ncbi:hypothetical protein LZ554_000451 [Drepanopeziza brunnea f. sp. 'monogermtubi']|nr:hypothetical protein LZ554_000451 [Drepanopeziza brunnea f. sp. 'monogermtubi']
MLCLTTVASPKVRTDTQSKGMLALALLFPVRCVAIDKIFESPLSISPPWSKPHTLFVIRSCQISAGLEFLAPDDHDAALLAKSLESRFWDSWDDMNRYQASVHGDLDQDGGERTGQRATYYQLQGMTISWSCREREDIFEKRLRKSVAQIWAHWGRKPFKNTTRGTIDSRLIQGLLAFFRFSLGIDRFPQAQERLF